MTFKRRNVIWLGGGIVAALGSPGLLLAKQVVTVEMRGTARGEKIWFDPIGLSVSPGTTVRFINKDPGNSHTATAYHPDLFGREKRIPALAQPWDSDFLLPGDSFDVTLDVPGVYDYYCIPHEMAAMVGRIVVGTPNDAKWSGAADDASDISAEVLAAFPKVETILNLGNVRVEGTQ